eukprot:6188437-Pleurochrysis_carterae.AAC.2
MASPAGEREVLPRHHTPFGAFLRRAGRGRKESDGRLLVGRDLAPRVGAGGSIAPTRPVDLEDHAASVLLASREARLPRESRGPSGGGHRWPLASTPHPLSSERTVGSPHHLRVHQHRRLREADFDHLLETLKISLLRQMSRLSGYRGWYTRFFVLSHVSNRIIIITKLDLPDCYVKLVAKDNGKTASHVNRAFFTHPWPWQRFQRNHYAIAWKNTISASECFSKLIRAWNNARWREHAKLQILRTRPRASCKHEPLQAFEPILTLKVVRFHYHKTTHTTIPSRTCYGCTCVHARACTRTWARIWSGCCVCFSAMIAERRSAVCR